MRFFIEDHYLMVTAAIIGGFLLDLIFGDPSWIPHPVVWIGRMIDGMAPGIHRMFPKHAMGQILAGAYLVFFILFDTIAVFGGITWLFYYVHPLAGVALEAFWCAQSLALKGLMRAANKVKQELINKNIPAARSAVGEIVGRDTDELEEDDIIRATVETVAENTSDGVCAPLFYMMIGGAIFAWIYKAINTLDSMIGYKNKKYIYFGKAAARLDDLVNLIPSRLTALCMILAAALLPGYDGNEALRIWWRDRYTQESPNATQTESVMAGALGVRLLWDASYFGMIVHKPPIGDSLQPIVIDDIDRANRLSFVTSILFFVFAMTVRGAVYVGLHTVF